MNLAEKLAREISRVTKIKSHYEEAGRRPGVNVAFALYDINDALEQAFAASGSNDVLQVMKAHARLEEIKE